MQVSKEHNDCSAHTVAVTVCVDVGVGVDTVEKLHEASMKDVSEGLVKRCSGLLAENEGYPSSCLCLLTLANVCVCWKCGSVDAWWVALPDLI